MAYNMGVKVGVEGEKEFKKALSEINGEMRVLGSEMKLTASQFDKNEKSVASYTAQNEVLNKQIEAQKDKVSLLEDALRNASDEFGENDKRTQAWATKLNLARADLNNMERAVDDNKKAIDEMGTETKATEEPVASLGEEIKKTGEKSKDAEGKFDGLGKAAVAVGKTAGAAMAALGTAAMAAGAALVKLTVDAAKYADDFITLSETTGVSTDNLQAYAYMAELTDVSVDTLTKTMARQVKGLQSAVGGTGATADAYKQLGVEITNSNGELKDAEEVYWETIAALGELENETERDALAMSLFGRSARDLVPIINLGAEGMAEFTAEAHAVGAVLSEETLESLGAFDDSLQRLKQGAAAAQRTVGTMLLPQLNDLASDGAALLGKFSGRLAEAGGDFGKISEAIGETLGDVLTVVMEHLPKILQIGLDIVLSLVDAIVKNLPKLVASAVEIIKALVSGLVKMLPQVTKAAVSVMVMLAQTIIENLPIIIQAATELVITFAQGLADALPELIPSIVEAMVTIVQTLVDNIPMLIDAALQLLEGLAEGIIEALPILMEAIPEIIVTIIDVISGNLGMIIEVAVKIILALIQGIIDSLPKLMKAIPKVIDAIVNVLVNNIDMVIDAGIQLLLGLVKAIPQIVVALGRELPAIISAIVKGLRQGWGAIYDVGKNLIEGLWEGIKSMTTWVTDKIKGFSDGVLKGIKKFFGIESPSKVFRDVVGKNLALGIGEGFASQMKTVSQSMANAIPTAFDDINLATNIRAVGYPQAAFAGAGGGVINIYPQELTQAQTDYLINKIDREWGRNL